MSPETVTHYNDNVPNNNKDTLKVTYHENLTFPGFRCYNQVPGASTNQGNMKKINPVTLFW